jgi:hypothetical protein
MNYLCECVPHLIFNYAVALWLQPMLWRCTALQYALADGSRRHSQKGEPNHMLEASFKKGVIFYEVLSKNLSLPFSIRI